MAAGAERVARRSPSPLEADMQSMSGAGVQEVSPAGSPHWKHLLLLQAALHCVGLQWQGPLCFWALGTFARVAFVQGAGRDGSASPLGSSAGHVDSVDLHLVHNTLVIMWPPCQEEWRHEVSLLSCLAGCCSMTAVSAVAWGSRRFTKADSLPDRNLQLPIRRLIEARSAMSTQ